MASKVYFADFRAPSWRENLPQKLARLMMTAGFGDIDMEGKYVAIKLHFGEPGNLAYLRPNWAKAVADLVKSQGGKPFLTDCNTLYVGGRKNALDHIESAYVNGFTPYSTGCHILIGDGLKGNDIPISAQIVSLADVYDALTSERCYKKAFSHETAMRMILNGECGAFNPLLLECLTDIQAELQEKSQNIAVNH